MKLIVCLILIHILAIQTTFASQSHNSAYLIAKNGSSSGGSVYDPFADYSEFENTGDEQEDINFFQNGRPLTLGAVGGAQLFTLNLAHIYKLGPLYGAYLDYFFDIQFAIQLIASGSNHTVSFITDTGEEFVGRVLFKNIGLDLKYFLDSQLFRKQLHWVKPFFIIGMFYSTSTLTATITDQTGIFQDRGFGFNFGGGIEFLVSKKIHIGVQYLFHYVTLDSEAIPLSLQSNSPVVADNTAAEGSVASTNTPPTAVANTNFLPYGDWMSVALLLGVNF